MNAQEMTQIEQWGRAATPEELQKQASLLTTEQISRIIPAISAKYDTSWRQKTCSLICGLKEAPQLETAGKVLNLAQVFEVIHDVRLESKLSPIFVGMPHQVFVHLLLLANPKELQVLKLEGITEPVQHHLMQMSHEMAAQMNEYDQQLNHLSNEINLVDLEEITRTEIKKFLTKIEAVAVFYQEILGKAIKALTVAWNTNRIDIVEKISDIKENAQRFCKDQVARIYELLQTKLNTVFERPNHYETHIDDEPAIEALVCFSIWYLQDYWELGLVPSIERKEQLDAGKTETERNAYREKLFVEAENNLTKIGLKTLKDLKEAHIYSKKALIEYINEKILT